MKIQILFCLLIITSFSISSFADKPSKTKKHPSHVHVESYEEPSTHVRHGNTPWDFSAMLGLYSPGVSFGGLAAYRITNNILPNTDQSLSVESGLNIISVSDNIAGTGISYTLIEVPIQARWDFYVDHGKFLVGPRAGFNYLTASTVSVNGVNYAIARSGALFVQVGGSAIYYFSPQFGVRANLSIGGYTTLAIGLNYAL